MLAAEGDLLWTPARVPPSALPAHPFLPAPRLVHGALPTVDAWVPWAVVPELPRGASPAVLPGLPLTDALRRAPRPTLEVQRRVGHRRFATRLARDLGCALPGAAWLETPEQLARHLDALALAPRAWVLKAPHAAAGEGLALHRVEAPLSASRIERAFARHGALLFEPWEARAADFGASAWIDAEGRTHEVGLHALASSPTGGFRGVTAPPADALPAGLEPAHADALRATLRTAGDALAAAGHRGPFGIDAYLRGTPARASGDAVAHTSHPAAGASPARTPPAAPGALRPLVEINARLGFGHLVHALAERLRRATPAAAERPCALRLAGPRHAPPPGVVPLVRPADGRGVWVWSSAAS